MIRSRLVCGQLSCSADDGSGDTEYSTTPASCLSPDTGKNQQTEPFPSLSLLGTKKPEPRPSLFGPRRYSLSHQRAADWRGSTFLSTLLQLTVISCRPDPLSTRTAHFSDIGGSDILLCGDVTHNQSSRRRYPSPVGAHLVGAQSPVDGCGSVTVSDPVGSQSCAFLWFCGCLWPCVYL